jgi:hypothetical protein
MKRLGLLALFAVLSLAARAQSASPGFTKIATVTSGTAYTDSTCANQTTCYYQITAVDASGHESPAGLCATTQACFATNQAMVSMPSNGTHVVAVSWTASPATGATYNVYKAVGPLPPTNGAAVAH